jgi:flagellar hook-basal body complex protein FliE
MDMDIKGLGKLAQPEGLGKSGSDVGVGDAFGAVLSQALNQTVQAQKDAAALTYAAAQGQEVNSQELIMALSKADLTLQTMVAVRDKATDAYQQIMQMPI